MKDFGSSMLSSYQASNRISSICHNLIRQRQRSGRTLKENVHVFVGHVLNQQSKSSKLFDGNYIFF